MRRKTVEPSGGLPPLLGAEGVPVFEDDYSRSLRWRLERYAEWEAAYLDWRGSREAWAGARGWPTGEGQRLREELDFPIPDAPFDPGAL